MKKYFIVSLSVFLSLIVVVKAQTGGSVPLMPVPVFTFNFTNDLSVGKSGREVNDLQVWLINNGYDIPAISSKQAVAGYFGTQTKQALMRYQRDQGLPPTGFFGPLTRGRVNGNTSFQSLRVLSPNGNETLVKGTSHTITWTGAPGILNQTGKISFIPEPTPCVQSVQPCATSVSVPLEIASPINLSTRSYTWTVGKVSIGCADAPSCNYELPARRYKVSICATNGLCDLSDDYFNIVSNTTGNLPPTINSIDAPTALAVNQTGTWTVRATDPQGSQLTYSVDWGEPLTAYHSAPCPVGYMCTTTPQATQQSSTFTHSFVNPGTYTVKFTVRNSTGLTAQTSATVTVTRTTAVIPTVISPNGGEFWIANSVQSLKWTAAGMDVNGKIDMYLDRESCAWTAPGAACVAIGYLPYVLDRNIPINATYNWIVATDIDNKVIPNGEYRFRVCKAGSTTECDSSNSFFTISSGAIPVN